jgi:hypothetical protein
LSSYPTKSKLHPRTIRHPNRVANWLHRGFRQVKREAAETNHQKKRAEPSKQNQGNHVTFHDETESQRTKRKRWLKSQVYYESQLQQRHPPGWNRRIPVRFQDKGCKLEHHGIHTPRKRQRKQRLQTTTHDDNFCSLSSNSRRRSQSRPTETTGFQTRHGNEGTLPAQGEVYLHGTRLHTTSQKTIKTEYAFTKT